MGIREAVKACTTREQADDVMMGMELSGKARRRILRVYHALPSVRASDDPRPPLLAVMKRRKFKKGRKQK